MKNKKSGLLISKVLSTVFGIGYVKGGGTFSSILCSLFWILCFSHFKNFLFYAILFSLLVVFVGIWSAQKVETIWGIDSNKVVIDEWAGMCITLLGLPVNWVVVLIGLILFRFFDIVKPLGIRRMEKFPGGWGVMADDILAGIYANVCLEIIFLVKAFYE